MGDAYIHMSDPLDRQAVPEPILDGHPGVLDLYWKAWECAWDHVVMKPGAPQTPYMDEAFDPNTVWLWDTCFMALFCRYGTPVFPGVGSLGNLYAPIHDHTPTPLAIQHLDNPPLFAWVELECARHTGDLERLHRVFTEKRYLQKHFEFFEGLKWGQKSDIANAVVHCEKTPQGYRWGGVYSGMDNSPRAEATDMLWFDAAAQQALAARCIIEIARLVRSTESTERYEAFIGQTADLLNTRYWHEGDGYYYDIHKDSPWRQERVKTPATFWPLLAGLCSPEQARRLADHAASADHFGGPIPWPSVARCDPTFRSTGNYWRGGVWLPTAYMATRALTQAGFDDIADRNAVALVKHMARTFAVFDPHTIWECYSPAEPRPATNKDDVSLVRDEFCGWSALGPISMLIENWLGFRSVDGLNRVVTWRLRPEHGRHGIRRLRVGTAVVDLEYDGGAAVRCRATAPLVLQLNGRTVPLDPGESAIAVDPAGIPLRAVRPQE